ncbi:anti-sigma factor [Streptomyces sp. CC224B]|uniref:anti-sigma factor n=1 Tax=Streptomyces sp. CC224B TaxID=3044571 RepID=UPI0024A82248|nr:anti-sigma factor [Streptomyces sp. CC224B]
MTRAELHTLTGAYALGALDGSERAAFEEHLAACPACAQEVRELTATAARLGSATATVPRPALREAVLRRISTVRQVPPRSAPAAEHRSPAPRTRRVTRWVLAACLALTTGAGTVAAWQYQRGEEARRQAGQARQEADGLAALLAAPDARTRAARLPGGAGGSVVVSRRMDRAAFVAARMDPPPDGKVYQLWFDDGGSMRPAGLMRPGGGPAAVLLTGGLGGATGMGITVEPAGGSRQPSTAPIVAVDFPAASRSVPPDNQRPTAP